MQNSSNRTLIATGHSLPGESLVESIRREIEDVNALAAELARINADMQQSRKNIRDARITLLVEEAHP